MRSVGTFPRLVEYLVRQELHVRRGDVVHGHAVGELRRLVQAVELDARGSARVGGGGGGGGGEGRVPTMPTRHTRDDVFLFAFAKKTTLMALWTQPNCDAPLDLIHGERHPSEHVSRSVVLSYVRLRSSESVRECSVGFQPGF